ncbi:MAG: hypothetical protein LKF87_10200 [Clostridium tyrobutyricum]|jgi:hypothetical protein|uniref:hypothetical protein n=1 Tax=Clostridium tyrobutyricum TaxID=1519 RepID=UPI00242FCC84|nr:hypothetical protein [Clostridium tyrobutyricum]MCH4200137.1 hypothetical protein [Clostridium tyrobutyricum]MCH4259321.1 hypothetical protein [Clostridium tyrobutyricum]
MANIQRGIGINLGNKDADLKTWFKKLKALNLEQSFYIQKALYASLENKKIFLGSIIPDESIDNFRTSYTIPKSDIKVIEYLQNLNSKKIKSATFIKNLIRQSIRIAKEPKDEFIPSYTDMYSYSYKNINIDTDLFETKPEKLALEDTKKEISKKTYIKKSNKEKVNKNNVNPLINLVK